MRPYEYPKEQIQNWLTENGLKFLLLNTLGRLSSNDAPGAGIVASRATEFREIFDLALGYCTALKGKMIHVTAGPVPSGLTAENCEQTFITNLRINSGELRTDLHYEFEAGRADCR